MEGSDTESSKYLLFALVSGSAVTNNFNSASSGQDKGHQNQFNLLIESVKNGGESIIPMSELVNTTLASFAAVESLKTGAWVNL
jgi:hypothetical protein